MFSRDDAEQSDLVVLDHWIPPRRAAAERRRCCSSTRRACPKAGSAGRWAKPSSAAPTPAANCSTASICPRWRSTAARQRGSRRRPGWRRSCGAPAACCWPPAATAASASRRLRSSRGSSNLTQLPALPMLAANLVRWASGWAPAAATAGVPFTRRSGTGHPHGHARSRPARRPCARVLTRAPVVLDPGRPGLYSVHEIGPATARSELVAVNAAEASPTPSTPVDLRSARVGARQPSPRRPRVLVSRRRAAGAWARVGLLGHAQATSRAVSTLSFSHPFVLLLLLAVLGGAVLGRPPSVARLAPGASGCGSRCRRWLPRCSCSRWPARSFAAARAARRCSRLTNRQASMRRCAHSSDAGRRRCRRTTVCRRAGSFASRARRPRRRPSLTFAPGLEAGATDLESAIGAAIGLAPSGGRVAVLSDGGQTHGDLLATAPLARRRGVEVDWVNLGESTRSDAAITAIAVPPVVHLGDTVPLTLTVHSTVPARAVLCIRTGDGGHAASRAGRPARRGQPAAAALHGRSKGLAVLPGHDLAAGRRRQREQLARRRHRRPRRRPGS